MYEICWKVFLMREYKKGWMFVIFFPFQFALSYYVLLQIYDVIYGRPLIANVMKKQFERVI